MDCRRRIRLHRRSIQENLACKIQFLPYAREQTKCFLSRAVPSQIRGPRHGHKHVRQKWQEVQRIVVDLVVNLSGILRRPSAHRVARQSLPQRLDIDAEGLGQAHLFDRIADASPTRSLFGDIGVCNLGDKSSPVVLNAGMAVCRSYLSGMIAMIAINLRSEVADFSVIFNSIRAAMFESTCQPRSISSSKP